MVIYCILAAVTVAYLFQAGIMDVREKKIYSFPCMVLTILWAVYLVYAGTREMSFLIGFWLIHIVLFIFLNNYKIWGAGDSDMLLLFANVYLSVAEVVNIYVVSFWECIGLITALCLSLIIGTIEHQLTHKEIRIKSKVAVVPGISIVSCVLIVGFVIKRCLL